jgi:hypothetical protein
VAGALQDIHASGDAAPHNGSSQHPAVLWQSSKPNDPTHAAVCTLSMQRSRGVGTLTTCPAAGLCLSAMLPVTENNT